MASFDTATSNNFDVFGELCFLTIAQFSGLQ